MGLLVDGVWKDQWYDTKKSEGKFVRQDSKFRQTISSENGAEFPVESGRYHLYVSLACPWAHRTLIFRKLKGLEEHISVSVVSPDMLDKGWVFSGYEGATEDHLFGFDYMHQVYTKAKPDITTRVTVPVLWDKKKNTIVNNESADIIRIFNDAFNELTGNYDDYYPKSLRSGIDEINDYVYHRINNGVYKSGFATTQEAYEEALHQLFEGLDHVESILEKQRYLMGNTLTEADWRLFTTLIRFDPVYVGHFKCNLKRIADYPNLSAYVRELYQIDGVAETTSFDHIKRHYYFSHTMINPTQVVPSGPIMDLESEHGRALI
ncbi:glutathione S-transferase family protein [Glaciecola sp. MH2013]|uniref:glutathione S-transferase family protein n=1 Tax=Glaciecola sp. MH2013 TaxID=2785524 RepID=UPI00189E6F71|nr:glutathione S-transferase family protein [Glaciecola sp. MH2013]MBF7072667.1 glutathione S-transferase family protein [Glaciecola sp. MH2013]